jgi:hypothetical protein
MININDKNIYRPHTFYKYDFAKINGLPCLNGFSSYNFKTDGCDYNLERL